MAIGSVESNLNRAQPTECASATPKPTNDPNRDVASAASSVESNGKSDYVESREKMLARSANTSKLMGKISKL